MQNTNSLAHLFEYRVSDGRETVMKPNRYQASKQLLSWLNRGADKDNLCAEKLVNGKWQSDNETFTLLDKHATAYAEKRAQNGAKPKEQDAVKTALKMLSQAVRIATSASQLTDEHIEAVLDRCEMFRDAVREQDAAEPEEIEA